MRKVWQFLQYNNAIPIGLFVVLGGAGATFAASPQAQQAVFASHEEVQSVDNTYIVAADLSTRDFGLRIVSVEEDEENYYVSYEYNTISIVDYVWREVLVSREMRFSKKELLGKDLGLFVAKQLGEELMHELAYLTEVQTKEREKGATLKTVAVEYSGLVGRMLDPTEKTFAGYVPVVEEPKENVAAVAAAGPGESFDALPPPRDIDAMVAAAVAKALAQQGQLGDAASAATASTTAATEPGFEEPSGTSESSPTASSTPPVEPVASSTPPTPPATTTSPTEPPPTTTPSTPEPEPPALETSPVE